MRKKVLRTFVAAVLIASLLSVPAFADTAVIVGADVNLRSGPGTNYRVVDCLPEGTSLTVTDRSNENWYAVTYNGETGFMSSHYLSMTEIDSTAILVADGDEGKPGQIDGMYVRFRSGPSSDSAILAEYNRGKSLTITGTSGDWTAVTIDGQNGYVFSQFVREGGGNADDSAATVIQDPPAAAPASTPVPTAKPAAASGGGREGTIVGIYVRFRSGPSTSHTIIDTYSTGKALTITGTSGDWTAVTIDGQSGYVYSEYVKEG
ncbi:MAG: SH3 domain-containing protein, partial [Oscillospiraceae bacterium]|nr:SH3 domain-containing protein [Oscillospiraceae bacterium]